MYIKIIVNVKCNKTVIINTILWWLCPVIAVNLSKLKLVGSPNMSNKFNNDIHLNGI